MARLISLSLAVFTMFCVMVATERSAWGYIDPGSGFVALQTFASVMAACGYFMRRRIASLFAKDAPTETPVVPPAAEGETR